MEREERKEPLIKVEETEAKMAKVGRDLKAARELLLRLGGALFRDPDWLVFSNRSSFTFTPEKTQALSFDFKRLPDYEWIADCAWKYQQLAKKQSELRRKLGK